MFFRVLKEKKVLKNYNVLDLTPVRMNEHIISDAGLVTILIPRYKSGIMNRLLEKQGRDKNFKLDLDDLGSVVWLGIDSEKKIRELCDILEEKFGDKAHPVEQRLVKFVSMLYQNELIRFKETAGIR